MLGPVHLYYDLDARRPGTNNVELALTPFFAFRTELDRVVFLCCHREGIILQPIYHFYFGLVAGALAGDTVVLLQDVQCSFIVKVPTSLAP